MKASTLTIALLIICAPAFAGDAPAPDPKAMQEAMQKMGTIGAEHAAMAKDIGEWETQETMWMAPGAPPMTSKGSSTIASTLDGKWFRQDYRGEMMGQPFTGLGLNGYDTLQKKYVSVWTDSFSTGLCTMTGTSEDGGKTVSYTGRLEHCPMTGGPLDMRSIITHESADRFTMTMFHAPEGQPEVKAMEMIYTRKKK
ncbi:MAG: DUF1579 domain-containing protein [Planctomycetes bacterium]|nr:DUF1579 domain-containing protein [Planctomycetota bacterium]